MALFLLFLPLTTAAITIPPGFSRILFSDDFSLLSPGSQPSTSKWFYSLGTSYPGGPARWGTNEIQSFTSSPSNIAITSSNPPSLRITPLVSSSSRWTSSRIETLPKHDGDIACPPSSRIRIEASLKFGSNPAETQLGIWPAFWAMGSIFRDPSGNYTAWPAAGEIDIAESVNGVEKLYHALHCGWAPGGPCDEYNGLKSITPLPRREGEFHTVAVEIDRTNPGGNWRGESVSWYLDGRRVFRVDGNGFASDQEWVWTAVTRGAKFLILNVSVGGDFADNAENPGRVKTPTPATRGGEGAAMEVRYVAVFGT